MWNLYRKSRSKWNLCSLAFFFWWRKVTDHSQICRYNECFRWPFQKDDSQSWSSFFSFFCLNFMFKRSFLYDLIPALIKFQLIKKFVICRTAFSNVRRNYYANQIFNRSSKQIIWFLAKWKLFNNRLMFPPLYYNVPSLLGTKILLISYVNRLMVCMGVSSSLKNTTPLFLAKPPPPPPP